MWFELVLAMVLNIIAHRAPKEAAVGASSPTPPSDPPKTSNPRSLAVSGALSVYLLARKVTPVASLCGASYVSKFYPKGGFK